MPKAKIISLVVFSVFGFSSLAAQGQGSGPMLRCESSLVEESESNRILQQAQARIQAAIDQRAWLADNVPTLNRVTLVDVRRGPERTHYLFHAEMSAGLVIKDSSTWNWIETRENASMDLLPRDEPAAGREPEAQALARSWRLAAAEAYKKADAQGWFSSVKSAKLVDAVSTEDRGAYLVEVTLENPLTQKLEYARYTVLRTDRSYQVGPVKPITLPRVRNHP
jgi:hypothetical protein